jgi:hypothetical protein
MTILFLTSILSIWINGAFIEESTSSEIAESPMQYESQGQYTWQLVFDTEPLGAEPYWSPRNPSIAIDSNDSIWVTFEDADGLYLAQGNNPQVAEQFASLTDVNGPIKSSLAIDSAGWPHVSYYESDDVDLKYATKDPTTSQWLITTVDSTGDVGDSNAIVLDSNDQPHISYIDSTNDDLKYANYDGSTWQISTLDTSLFGERFEMDSTSIAIDSNDYVHISYSNNSASYNSLKYTRDGPQGWTNTSLSTPGYGSLWSDIAIDSNDDVHISYSDNFQQTLEYFTIESGAWVNATIDGWPLSNSAEIEEETSIAINSSGVPHISYWDRSTDYIMHATIDDGGSWSTTIVDDSGEAGIHSSIAIDSSDSVHISYIDDSNYSAKRAIAYIVIQAVQSPSGFQIGHANQNVTMSVGYSHACAILENNTMTCWGNTWDGALGMYDGSPNSGFNTNYDPIWATAWPENEVASVSAGYEITCAILTNASTYCLGNGTNGLLGNGEGDGTTWIERETIQYVDFGPGRTAVAIDAAQLDTSCALLDNGDVACWGQWADPSNTYANEPYVVDLQNRKAVGIGVGPSNGCAVLEDGGVMCWGDNTAGELGTGTGNYEATPVNATIWQGHDVVGISVGEYYNCALLRNGSVACGSFSLDNWVGLPAGKTAISVSISDYQQGCVLLSDRSLHCWGYPSSVGNQSASGIVSMSNPIPVNISSNLDVLAVDVPVMTSTAGYTACALLSNTEIKCWGTNTNALLGNGYGGPNCNCDELEPTTLMTYSLNSSYWDWDSSVAPFAADDRDRDGDSVLNIFDKCLETPVGSTVDQDGCSTSPSDDDDDGVDNSADLCPNTPAGETVDLDGCSDSQLDDDGDGVMNDADQCPNTSPGASVDADGCALGQADADGDGVSDLIDDCPNTPAGETVDIYGCSDSQLDDDEDGVMNDADQCPGTAAGASVNSDGCSISQLDADGDGVSDLLDACPNTPAGEAVDIYGCSNSQLDDDGDGVMNNADQCSNTPPGEAVDNYGCSDSQLDDDSDGVMNNADQCPNTPAGESVDVNGCSGSQLDDDSDGVMNSVDQCPNTPPGETVDAVGCSPSQYDGDGDGVPDQSDQCPNTPSGVNVGADGCNYSPTCNVSYDDGAGNIVSLESELSMGTGSSSSSLSLPTGTYQFIVECTDPESDMLSMTVTLDGGSAMTFAGSPLSTGAISVPVQDGMSISKTVTYYWTDGLNYGSYEIEVSLIGDDASDPDDGWLPGFEVWITLLAIIASLFFNRTRRII